MAVEERVIEALKRLRGFDFNLDPQEAKKLYELNIQRLTEDFTAVIEDCAKCLDNHKPVPVFAIMGYHESEDEEGNWRKDAISMPASNLVRALAAPTENNQEKGG